jgi:hypothetical protein
MATIEDIQIAAYLAEREIAHCCYRFPAEDCVNRSHMMKARMAVFRIQDHCKDLLKQRKEKNQCEYT